jgi:glycosyltransferase involved in cell wall biosynthesis
VKILVLAPLPPPITGHSLASKVVVDVLRETHEVEVVDLGRGSLHDGTITAHRLLEVAKALVRIWRVKRKADAIYLTIAETPAGNLKDLAIYCLCAGRLSRMYLHLHGGTIGVELFDRYPAIRRVNAAFIRRMAGVIISGRSHEEIFANMTERRRIHVVPNFAQDHLFVSLERVAEKFEATQPLRVLYISSMTKQKGYEHLLNAYCGLDEVLRAQIELNFAGRFDSQSERESFTERIRGQSGIHYHGLVDEDEKRRLFAAAHVFCLPTMMLEGQPISILEGYASGCAVITTGQRGIRDVFEDGRNGFEILAGDVASIGDALARSVREMRILSEIAIANRRIAEDHYRTRTFAAAMRRVLEA